MKATRYSFRGKIWKYKGSSGWHFVTLPKNISVRIRKNHAHLEEGWGRMKCIACIGKIKWNTSIWYDSKAKSFLLPLKASVRRTESLELDSVVSVRLELFNEDQRFTPC